MGIKIKHSMLIFLLIIISCETSDLTDEIATKESNEIQLHQNKDLKSSIIYKSIKTNENYSPSDNWDSTQRLHNRMQWVSYMTAQVLLRSEDARILFQNELDNSSVSNTVALEKLLDPNLANLSFYNEFVDEFLLNYHGSGTCDGIGRPRNRPTPPGDTGGATEPQDLDAYLANAYITALLERDCLEFYLPNGFIFIHSTGPGPILSSHIRSTAHPLSAIATSNDAFNHINSCFVDEITVDNSTNGFVILVRPYRSNTGCLYENYYVDFEDFLN